MLSVLLPFSYSPAQQSQIGQWRNYTDMKAVRSVIFTAGRIFAATGGGMFMVDEASAKYSRWTNSENLSTNDLTALSIDSKNRIWVGSSNGAIDVYDPSSGAWQSIQDIMNSNRPQKAIHQFFSKGDSMFVATDFGVSVFSFLSWEFKDTYASFGFTTQPAVSGVLVVGNQVYVGTDEGVAIANLASPNLSAPTSWTVYTSAQGLPFGVTAMAVYRDTLVLGTLGGIYFLAGTAFQQVAVTAGKAVAGLAASPSGFTFVWNGSGAFTVESSIQVNGPTQVVAVGNALQATSIATTTGLASFVVGTSSRGAAEWNGIQWNFRVPNGPQSNLFSSLAVDANGMLWAASGINGGGRGFYSFDPSQADSLQWKNFTADVYPILAFTDRAQPGLSNDYFKSSVGVNGSVWVSSWGDGVVEVVKDTIRRKLNSTSIPTLAASVPQNSLFVVVGGVATDPQGATWFVNRIAVNGNFLAKLVNDTTFQYFRNLYNTNDGFFASMAIDQNGTKWFANSEPSQKSSNGLYYFNENQSVAGTANTGGWGNLTVSEGLPNNTVLSVAVDLDNSIWVGTDLGVTIVADPLNPATTTSSSFPLREQSIQAIAVDALNNKWIGTKQGVFVVNSDGTQLINQYSILDTNGKLVDDDVRAIAIDQHRGIVYLGTQKGMSSLSIAAVQSLRSYTTLECGPNPYVLPNDRPVSINNLVSNSTIKILSVNGTLISEFSAQGAGRAFWDGKDQHGKYVASGIYFVVAFAENGSQVANGKIAVVHK